MRAKPIADLVRDDLLAHAIWEFATDAEDEGDETYVRPVDAMRVPSDVDYQVYHVACDLRTAGGRELLGFMSVCNGEIEDPVPGIVGSTPLENFSLEHPPDRRTRAAFEALMGAPFNGVFPVSWRLRVLVNGERDLRSGVFAGIA